VLQDSYERLILLAVRALVDPSRRSSGNWAHPASWLTPSKAGACITFGVVLFTLLAEGKSFA
jgi:hypothetical protein